MSEVKVNKISPRSGTNVQLGDSGDTITVPSGATLDASNATTTLPANVVTTTGTQTLTNKTIGSSQLTGALPALDGSALTGIPDTIAPTRHSIRPSLNLDFANSKALDPRITFTRASNATYYDGYTSVKAEENLLSYSQELNNWVALRGSVTANATTAPDGTTTADELSRSGDTTNTVYYQNIQVIGNNDYVFSVYAKTNGKDYVILSETSSKVSGTVASTWFNISTGAVGTTDADHTATITDVGNGWYRCSIKFTAYDNGTSDDYRVETAETDNSRVMVDDGQGIYLWGAQLEQRDSISSYTPTTTAPITKYQPALQTAGNNVARFDHNPTTGESLGLLIEEQRTNLFIESEDFASSAWQKTGSTVEANAIIAPDGTLTGTKHKPTSGSGNYHYIGEGYASGTSGDTFTASIYAKAGEYDNAVIWIFPGNVVPFGAGEAIFDLTNGTITKQGQFLPTITDVGNGWYKLTVTFTLASTGTFTVAIGALPDGETNQIWLPTNDFNGAYFWGAQLEQASFPTSYIKTTGSQVTRSADFCKMENIDTSEWFKQGEGTAYVEATGFYGGGSYPRIFSISDGTNNNRIEILRNNATPTESTNKYYYIETNDAGQSEAYIGNGNKILISYKLDDVKVVSQGNTVLTDSAGVLIGNLTTLNLGNDSLGQSQEGFGYIKKFSYYPLALTSNEITDLSEE